MSVRRGSAAVLVGALAIAACGDRTAVRDEDARTSRRADAIQGGVPDTSSVFAVAVLDDKGDVCSGTLIAPNLVLTARHCVAPDNGGATVDCVNDRFSPPAAPSTLRVSIDPDAAFETAAFHAAKVVVPTETAFCGHDVALIILAESVPAAVATPATPAIDPPLTDRVTYGSKLTAIGYGISSPTATDDGTRRKRTNIPIVCIPGDATLGCDPADFDMTVTELSAGNGLCSGDSGSGAYVPSSLVAGATPIVIGVLSRAVDAAGECTDAIYGRTDSIAALLVSTAKDAAAAGGYAPPTWADPTSPGPDAGASDGSVPAGEDPAAGDPDGGAASAASARASGTSGCSAARVAPSSSLLTVVVAACAVLVSRLRRRRRRH
jgi:hypothetical protein